jgi:hypothetical protein
MDVEKSYKDAALSALEEASPFLTRIKERLNRGQKLIFKRDAYGGPTFACWTWKWMDSGPSAFLVFGERRVTSGD